MLSKLTGGDFFKVSSQSAPLDCFYYEGMHILPRLKFVRFPFFSKRPASSYEHQNMIIPVSEQTSCIFTRCLHRAVVLSKCLFHDELSSQASQVEGERSFKGGHNIMKNSSDNWVRKVVIDLQVLQPWGLASATCSLLLFPCWIELSTLAVRLKLWVVWAELTENKY